VPTPKNGIVLDKDLRVQKNKMDGEIWNPMSLLYIGWFPEKTLEFHRLQTPPPEPTPPGPPSTQSLRI